MEKSGKKGKWFAVCTILALIMTAWAIQGEAQPSHTDIDNTPVNVDIFLGLINTSSQYISSYLTDSKVILDSDGDANVSIAEMRYVLCDNYTTTVLGKLNMAFEDVSEMSHALDNASGIELAARDTAPSAKYLQEVLSPYLEFYSNLTSHFNLHYRVLSLLKGVTTRYFYNATDANLSIALSELSRAIMAMESLRTVHNRLLNNVEGIRQIRLEGENHTNPYIATMIAGLLELKAAYDEYDTVIDFFQGVLKAKGPRLTIDVKQSVYYLTEDLQISGAFICDSANLAHVRVAIWLDNRSMGAAYCEVSGYFVLLTMVPADARLGTNVIHANLTFNDTVLASNRIEILIEKVPVLFTIDPLESDYSKDDAPTGTGLSRDIFGKPIAALELSIGLDGSSKATHCDLDGKFQYVLDLTGLGYGAHTLNITSKEDALHQSGMLLISFHVNQKTLLTLDPMAQTAQVGDGVRVTGTLLTADGGSLDGRTVTIIVNNNTYSTVTKDGKFQTSITFDTRGIYTIQAHFYSTDARLRNATSSVQYVSVKAPQSREGAGYLPLFVIAVIILVCLAAAMTYAFARSRAKAAHRIMKAKPPRDQVVTRRNLAQDLIEEAGVYSGPLLSSEQEAVIRQYQSYLSYMARMTGADLTYLTPSEVCALSIKSGAPAKETRQITRTFHKAYYTGVIVDAEDVKTMSAGIDRILGGAR